MGTNDTARQREGTSLIRTRALSGLPSPDKGGSTVAGILSGLEFPLKLMPACDYYFAFQVIQLNS